MKMNQTVGIITERIRKTKENISSQQAKYAERKAAYMELGAKAENLLIS